MDPIIESLTLVDELSLINVLDDIINTDKTISVGFLNQHAYNLMHTSNAIRADFFDLDYLFRDGKGIELACLHNNLLPQLNLNGTDFIPRLISHLQQSQKHITWFAYGTEQPWLDAGAKRLFNSQVFYSLDGFRAIDDYLIHNHRYQSKALNVVVLAMGMPKQEQVAAQLKQQTKNKLLIICGGAILDFQAGRVRRAPQIVRKLGLEWFYRLVWEPRRLFSRYILGIPVFFWRVYYTNTK